MRPTPQVQKIILCSGGRSFHVYKYWNGETNGAEGETKWRPPPTSTKPYPLSLLRRQIDLRRLPMNLSPTTCTGIKSPFLLFLALRRKPPRRTTSPSTPAQTSRSRAPRGFALRRRLQKKRRRLSRAGGSEGIVGWGAPCLSSIKVSEPFVRCLVSENIEEKKRKWEENLHFDSFLPLFFP